MSVDEDGLPLVTVDDLDTVRNAEVQASRRKSPAPYALYRHYVPLVRAALGPETARRCRHEGQDMPPEEARTRAFEIVDTLENHPA